MTGLSKSCQSIRLQVIAVNVVEYLIKQHAENRVVFPLLDESLDAGLGRPLKSIQGRYKLTLKVVIEVATEERIALLTLVAPITESFDLLLCGEY